MRSILPTGFNELIGLAKSTSMVYLLALPELFYTVQVIYRRNLEVIPLLMVATAWYLVIMTVLSLAQHYIERYFARGAVRNPTPLPFQSLFQRFRRPLPTFDGYANIATRAGFQDAAALRASGGAVRIHGISKSYGSFKVLDNVDLSLAAGSVTAILGP